MGDKLNRVQFHGVGGGNDNRNNNMNNTYNNTYNNNNISHRQPPLRERKQKAHNNKLCSP